MAKFCHSRVLSMAGIAFAGIVAVVFPSVGSFAQNVDGAFQTLSVEHIAPAEIEGELERILAGTNERFEIISDAKNHRLLVSGGPRVQEIARRVVESLDRPAPVKAADSSAEPILKTYPIKDRLNEVATEWETKFPKESGVRFAVDVRLSQILVLAPPSVHEQLSKTAAGKEIPVTPKSRGNAASDPKANSASDLRQATDVAKIHRANPRNVSHPEGEAVTQSIRLKRLRDTQFEDGLNALWGRPLPKATNDKGNTSTYVFDAGEGRKMTIQVDRAMNSVTLVGPANTIASWTKLIEAMDGPSNTNDQSTKLVSLQNADPSAVRKAVDAVASSGRSAGNAGGAIVRTNSGRQPEAVTERERAERALKTSLMAKLFQTKDGQPIVQIGPNDQGPSNKENPPAAQPAGQPAAQPGGPQNNPEAAVSLDGGLIGPVQIEYLEGLDIIIIRGHPKDVEKIKKLVQEIEDAFKETTPEIEIYPLKHVAGESLAALVRQLNDQLLATRQGNVSITPLGKPNSLLLIGRKEAVVATIALIEKLDQPVTPETQFQVFSLKFAPCISAQATVQEFFANRPGLGTKATVAADIRSNSLIVTASVRDLEEVGLLLKKIDVATSGTENELRVFPLKNTLAGEVAPILQNAINGQIMAGQRAGTQSQTQTQLQQPQQNILPGTQPGAAATPSGSANQPSASKSTMLRFETIDAKGRKEYKSGILTDVRVSADPRSNSLLISAPEGSMELLAALVRQLDQMPASEAQIKVFTIVNGDAQALATLLQSLFGQAAGAGNRQGAGGFQNFQNFAPLATAGGDDSTLIPMRISVDQRTNSVVVAGSSGDLSVVEAILLRLDASDIQQRKNTVYRLKNAPAADVANAVNQFLTSQRQLQTINPQLTSPFEQIEREVIVVAEPVNNSLIISATPRYFDEVKRLVEQLDARPSMVMIQVMIGEVTLSNTDEFGIEVGLQDSILFDRSLLGNLVTTTQTTTFGNPATTVQSQNVLAATNTPGFDFSGQPLGNSGSSQAIAGKGIVGGQGFSNFGVGRTNNELGFGGLVLSASSESVSALLRALKECRRMDVLSRPQIMTLDNQPAFIQVGERVPRITGVNISTTGQTNNVTLENVGLILGVTPRISPDGLVVMEIDAEKSQLGPEAEGIPVSITTAGQVIRSPRIATTTAQTTVSAISGQTVILGGLITKSRSEIHRRVPLISDIPLIGQLFRYDNISGNRKELLIIMTPHVIRSEQDNERLKHVEAARMNWCLSDVIRIHGESGLRGRSDEWTDMETEVIYPDVTPTAPEAIPLPAGGPSPAASSKTLPAPIPGKSGVPTSVKAPSTVSKKEPVPAGAFPILSPQNTNPPPSEASIPSKINNGPASLIPIPGQDVRKDLGYGNPAMDGGGTSATDTSRRPTLPVRPAQPSVDMNSVTPARFEWPVPN